MLTIPRASAPPHTQTQPLKAHSRLNRLSRGAGIRLRRERAAEPARVLLAGGRPTSRCARAGRRSGRPIGIAIGHVHVCQGGERPGVLAARPAALGGAGRVVVSRRAARLGRWALGPLALGSADVSVRSICTIVWVLTCVTAACLLSTCVWERHQRRGRQGTPARRAEPSRPLLRPRVLRACGEMRRDAPLGRQHTPQFSGPRDALQHAPATSACACLRCAACPACGSDRGESQRHTLQERA